MTTLNIELSTPTTYTEIRHWLRVCCRGWLNIEVVEDGCAEDGDSLVLAVVVEFQRQADAQRFVRWLNGK